MSSSFWRRFRNDRSIIEGHAVDRGGRRAFDGNAAQSRKLAPGGRLLKKCRTASDYRLYALPNTAPPKPGLIRDPGYDGPGLEVELWSLPDDAFGRFVAKIPAPLGIGKITLDDGSAVSGFLCESHAVEGAQDITRFGGWRAFVNSTNGSHASS